MKNSQMKTILHITGCLAVLAMAGAGCKEEQDPVDPCFGISCLHGECADGACDCDFGYAGPDCSEELTPQWIGVETVVLTGIFNACTDWDDDGDGLLVNDADVYIRILLDGREIYSSKDWAVENTSCSHGCSYPRALVIRQPAQTHTLEIYDADDTEDQLIGSVTFTPWEALRGWKFPGRATVFNLPQSCSTGWNSNHIPVRLEWEGIFYSF